MHIISTTPIRPTEPQKAKNIQLQVFWYFEKQWKNTFMKEKKKKTERKKINKQQRRWKKNNTPEYFMLSSESQQVSQIIRITHCDDLWRTKFHDRGLWLIHVWETQPSSLHMNPGLCPPCTPGSNLLQTCSHLWEYVRLKFACRKQSKQSSSVLVYLF